MGLIKKLTKGRVKTAEPVAEPETEPVEPKTAEACPHNSLAQHGHKTVCLLCGAEV